MRQATEATAEQKGFPERACATVTFQGMTHHYENIITRVPAVDWSWSNWWSSMVSFEPPRQEDSLTSNIA